MAIGVLLVVFAVCLASLFLLKRLSMPSVHPQPGEGEEEELCFDMFTVFLAV
jgi:hypothetical protein